MEELTEPSIHACNHGYLAGELSVYRSLYQCHIIALAGGAIPGWGERQVSLVEGGGICLIGRLELLRYRSGGKT